jgi:hypothetical protein
VRTARWVRRLALSGAAACAVAAVLPGGGASAEPNADAPNLYSTTALSRGFEVFVNTDPEPFPVHNAADFSVPQAQSDFGAGGASSADAWGAAPGGAETAPELICVFAPAGTCSQFPLPGGFPPPYAARAHASYPVIESSDAAGLAGNTFGGADVGLGLTAGKIHAEAHETSASAIAGMTDGKLLGGTPLTISAGSTRTTTSQAFRGNVLVTRAESTVNDITIAGLVKVKSVTTIAEVDNDGVHPPVNKSNVTVGAVTVAGQKASIDNKGIHVAGKGIVGGILGGVGESVSKQLKTLGLTITTVGIDKTKIDKHTESVAARGIVVNFSRSFKEVCGVNKALCQGFPQVPGCDAPQPIISQLMLGAFLNLCSPPVSSPKDTYLVRVAIGQASLTSGASVFTIPPCCSGTTGTTGTTGATGATGATGGVTGGSTGFTTGGSATGGFSGDGSTGFSDGGTTGGTNPPPAVAGQQVAYGESFGNTADRLKYFFPLLLLVAIGVLAGRLDKAPARLPGQPT